VKANELREMTGEELQQRKSECQKDMISFRLQLATGVVENVRLAREARREIARIKTVLNEREAAAAKGTQS
jgi:large subunit ribosomal protein L29